MKKLASPVLASWFLLAACGGENLTPTVLDDELAIELSPNGDVRRGSNTFTLTLSSPSGAVTADTIVVDPQMPAMGHGSSVTPKVVAESGGRYRIEEVVFTMPGTWDVHVRVSADERESERTFRYEVP